VSVRRFAPHSRQVMLSGLTLEMLAGEAPAEGRRRALDDQA
jgi:hypothetical protein